MANFCRSCIYWAFAFDRGGDEIFGICDSFEVSQEIVKEEKDCDEDGVVFTGQWFGCIHFRETDMVLIDITKEIEKKMENIQAYYDMTGQDFGYLMQGASQYGYGFIFKDLVSQALDENKKIVWTKRPVDGQELGLLDYELQPI